MAETIATVPDLIRAFDILHRPVTKVLDASEQDYSAGATKYEHDTRLCRRVAMFAKWANYTSVTVKLQRTYDGTTWTDIPNSSITATGNSIAVNLDGAVKIRVHVTATLSAGADTLEVWLYEEFGNIHNG